MAEMFEVNAPVRKPLFEGVQGENEARSIVFDITPWVKELGDGAVTATAKRSQDSQPYPVTVTKDGNTVTWKPTSTDTAFAGVGSFQLEYTVDDVLAKTCIWSTMVAPSLDPAGDPPDPYDNWLAEMRQIAADALQSEQNAEDSAEDAEAWAVGQRGGVDVPSTDPTYENNAKYWAEQSLANQYGAFIVKSASGDIASFNDGADDVPMKSVQVTITPKQAGSGDPSPSNVRPITGWTDADVTVTGANVWDEEWEAYSSDQIKGKNIIPMFPNTQYYAKTPQGVSINLYFADADDNSLGNWGGSNSVFTTPNNCAGAYLYVGVGYGATYNHDISINYPSTDTEYHPYTRHTTPVPLGQTVYGANVGVTEGEMKITKLGVDLGSLTWADTQTAPDADGRTVYYTSASWGAPTGGQLAICSVAVQHAPVPIGQLHVTSQGFTITGGDYYSEVWMLYTDHARTGAQVKSELNGQMLVANVSVVAQQTVQLTPTQVATLLGTNNVWSDAGSVEVEYRADPTLAYNELANVIVSLGGNL